MNFGTSKKQCPVCEQEVEKSKGVEKSGEIFCSEEHAKKYSEKLSEKQSKNKNHHSCCG